MELQPPTNPGSTFKVLLTSLKRIPEIILNLFAWTIIVSISVGIAFLIVRVLWSFLILTLNAIGER